MAGYEWLGNDFDTLEELRLYIEDQVDEILRERIGTDYDLVFRSGRGGTRAVREVEITVKLRKH